MTAAMTGAIAGAMTDAMTDATMGAMTGATTGEMTEDRTEGQAGHSEATLGAVHAALERIEAAAKELRDAVAAEQLTSAKNADIALRDGLAEFALAVAALQGTPSEDEVATLHGRLELVGDIHRRATATLAAMRSDIVEEGARARQARRGTRAYLEAATA